jgi:hydrogenase maturation protease
MEIRVLCLGNELLADDAIGVQIGRQLSALRLPNVNVVISALSGLHLFDEICGEFATLIIVDSIRTGEAELGTVHRLSLAEIGHTAGTSPHSSGLPELVAIAQALHLPMPKIHILAVEVGDCTTLGGPVSRDVESAMPAILEQVRMEIAQCTTEVEHV